MSDNPQIEDGYFKVAIGWWDAICRIRIPGEARQVLDFIIRKSYGWHNKEATVSLQEFCQGTNLKKPTIIRGIKTLLKMNIIIINDKAVINNDNEITKSYSFNKRFNTWRPIVKHYQYCKSAIINNDNSHKEVVNYKDKTDKDINYKEYEQIINNDNGQEHFEMLWKSYPKRLGKKAALRHYIASVKTADDRKSIEKALRVYLASENVKRGFIQHGSTWFNNWHDWVDYVEPVAGSAAVASKPTPQREITEGERAAQSGEEMVDPGAFRDLLQKLGNKKIGVI